MPRLQSPRTRSTAGGEQLAGAPAAAETIAVARGFSLTLLVRLGVGWDGQRLTIPIRDAGGKLCGLVRYTPKPRGRAPKALAVRGSVRDLFPAPETLSPGPLVLCEGEPDALALLSCGIRAVAIPGVGAWRRAVPGRFAGREVSVVLDCDQAGRTAAGKVAARLIEGGVRCRIIDLSPHRSDGFDATDALRIDALRVRRMLTAPWK